MKRLWIAVCGILVLSLIGLLLPSVTKVQAIITTSTPGLTRTSKTVSGRPIFVLLEFSEGARMGIGADSPSFALYDDGLIIYVRGNAQGEFEFASVKLNLEEFADLRRAFTIGDDFFALKAYYETAMVTDLPTNTIVAWDRQGRAKRVSVYGDLRNDKDARRLTPEPFVALFDRALAYTHAGAKTWLPEKLEVVVWEFQSTHAIPWPKDWPGLNDPTTVKRAGGSYVISIELSKLTAFRTLAQNTNAVLINGKTWAFVLHFPFPSEEAWRELKTTSDSPDLAMGAARRGK